MTDLEIQVAVAKLIGIPIRVKRWGYRYGQILSQGHYSRESALEDAQSHGQFVEPEEYETDNKLPAIDLNTMHEAEKILFPSQFRDLYKRDRLAEYRARLDISCVGHPGGAMRATAKQRAEALIQTCTPNETLP